MMTNPTDPKHVCDLVSIQRDVTDLQKLLCIALNMATHPESELAHNDITTAALSARFILDRLRALEKSVMSVPEAKR